MKVSEFKFNLPKELIAQLPLEKRDTSRLMVLDKKNKTIENKTFSDVLEYFSKGDCLVINNTKVIPARLYGNKNDVNVEILLLKNLGQDIWECIVKPRKKNKSWSKNTIWGLTIWRNNRNIRKSEIEK